MSSTRRSPRSGAAWLSHLVVFFRDQVLEPDDVPRVRPSHRRTGRVSVRQGHRRIPGDHRGHEASARDGELRRHLAQRHRVSRAPADGDDARRRRGPAVRRRHACSRTCTPRTKRCRPGCSGCSSSSASQQLGPRRRVEDARRPNSRQRRRRRDQEYRLRASRRAHTSGNRTQGALRQRRAHRCASPT